MVLNDNINHPDHYNIHEYECIDEMLAMFGIEDVIAFCKCNAWKYRYRANSKGDSESDNKKADWYINKAIELQCAFDDNVSGAEFIKRREMKKSFENYKPEIRHIVEC